MTKLLFIGGQSHSGKTSVLTSILRHQFKNSGESWAGFKPFDVGRISLEQNERLSDGERIQKAMSVFLHVVAISPYHTFESFPFFLSLQREGVKVDLSKITHYLELIKKKHAGVLVECLPGLLTPITFNKKYLQWMSFHGSSVLWVVSAKNMNMSADLAELQMLKKEGMMVEIVINTKKQRPNEDWLIYLWQTLQTETGYEVKGVLSYNPDENHSLWTKTLNEISFLHG